MLEVLWTISCSSSHTSYDDDLHDTRLSCRVGGL